jgi:hypothetical protein
VPSFTKKEPKDSTITGFNKKSSRKETKFFYLTPRSSYWVKENFRVNGKDCTSSSTHLHMVPSRFKTTKVILLR